MLALNKIVAIEIEGKRLHLVAVRKMLRGYTVSHGLTVENFGDRDPLALRPTVEEFYRRAGVDRSRTVVALPRASVVLRTLQFPKEVLSNLDNIMEYQVENFEPSDRSELAHGHQLIDRGDSTGRLEVLLAMARRAEVARLEKFFATLGLKPVAMICSTLGLAQLIQLEKRAAARENNFLLRLGEIDLEIVAILGGKVRLAKRVEFRLNTPRAEQVIEEVNRTRGELRLEEKKVNNIYLTGVRVEEEMASLRPQYANLPWRTLRIPAPVHSTLGPALFHSTAAAIGTAIAAMNPKKGLATDLMARGEIMTRPGWVWIPTFVLLGVSLLMLGATAVRPYVQQYEFLKQLNAEIARLKPQVDLVRGIEDQTDQFQKKAAGLLQAQNRDALNLEALRELSEIIPDTAWISEFTMRGDTVEISGYAENATALVPLLEQSSLFQDVALASGITRDPKGKEIFRIRAKFEY